MPHLVSQFGTVHLPTPRTVSDMRENAAEWLVLGELSFAEAQAHAADGNLDIAIDQTRNAESKLAAARAILIEAAAMQKAEDEKAERARAKATGGAS